MRTEIFSTISRSESALDSYDYINVTLPSSMFANGLLIALNNETTCNEKAGMLIIFPMFLIEMIHSRV